MSAPALTALVVTTDQGHVRVVDGGGQEQLSITAHARPVTCIALSPDGTLLATGSEDRAWKLFDATSGAEQACGRGHDSLGACICAKAADTVVKSDCHALAPRFSRQSFLPQSMQSPVHDRYRANRWDGDRYALNLTDNHGTRTPRIGPLQLSFHATIF